MGKSKKKSTVGFQYSFGMQALFGLAPISKILRVFTDNQDLITTPATGGEVVVSEPSIYNGGEVSDGVSGIIRYHLNGPPAFDPYLVASYGIDPTLVPRFDAYSYVVFTGTRTIQVADNTELSHYWEKLGLKFPSKTHPVVVGSGPFYFGNSPYPREFVFIAERTETTCPFGEFALLPYTHEDWGIVCNDFNPLVMYWEIFIKDDPDSYGSTWAAAAEVVFDEGIGIYFNSAGGDLEALEKEVMRYVNGRVYIDRQTGLKEIELIRAAVDLSELVTISEADLVGEPDIVDPDRSIFNNTIDATFRDRRKKFDDGAFTVQEGSHVAAYGVARQEGDYNWITNRELATQLALRDLTAIVGAGITGSIRVSGLRPDLHNGSRFILDLPTYDVSTVVCRILTITERGLRDNSVDIAFLADTFGIEVAASVIDDLPGVPSTLALPAVHQLGFELPYYLGLLVAGDSYPDEVAANEAFGQMGLVVERPNSRHVQYMIAVDSGDGYVAAGTGNFQTYTTLEAGITREETTITVAPIYGIDEDSILLIGGTEFVRINSIDISGVSTWEIEIGRGCIDTAPIPHASGASVFRAYDTSTNGLSYLDGEVIEAVAMTQTTSSTLPATEATPITIEFASRAIRPYPPGRFKVEGSYPDWYFGSSLFVGSAAILTWVGRNRLLQTDETFIEDHDAAAITPEAGTTYRVTIESFDEDMISLGLSLDVNVGAAVTYTTSFTDFAAGAIFARASVYSVRDGYQSWTAPSITRLYTGGVEVDESGVPILTEAGDFIVIEV